MTEKVPLKVVALCSGIGCQERGIENSGLFDMDVVATSEIDRDATISYAAIHHGLTEDMINNYADYPTQDEMRKFLKDINLGYSPEKDKTYDWFKGGKKFEQYVKKCWLACKLNHNLGDMSKIERLPEADLWFTSTPCTDLSVAGKLKGLNPDDKTRSSLIWQNIRLLKEAQDSNTLPKYIFLENVKNLVGKRFLADFETFNSIIESFGYNTYYAVMNAKNCGVPQNRERVFALYIHQDIDTGRFTFPKPFDNGLRLKDILEDEVDEKYYINTDKAHALILKLLDDGVIGEQAPQTQDQQELIYPSSIRSEQTSPSVSQPEQTVESATDKQKVPVYANYNRIERTTDVARTVLARDYKGFGTSNETSTGVVEYE